MDGIRILTLREVVELWPDPKHPRRPILSRANHCHWIGALDNDQQEWLDDLCWWWNQLHSTRERG